MRKPLPSIVAATDADVATIHRLAHAIWWPTYRDYIPHAQIALMLANQYTEEALHAQMEAGQHFSLALHDGQTVGFAGFRPKPADPLVMRIEKLYVLASEQGKGTGKRLIGHVAEAAMALGMHSLELNVNRDNPAVTYYRHQGFVITETVDIPYHGYVLNDFVMQKSL